MAQSQMVKTLEVCKVAPPPDLSRSAIPKSLPLTFFDLFWLRSPPFQNLFFYEIPSQNTLQFEYSIIPKLKQSLSLTLHHYLPLAGNLTWPQHSHKPIIKYVGGDGVSLTIAESNMDFYHLTSNHYRQETDYHLLLPQLEVFDERAAAMALQVTLFPNSGFSIGITAHHAILDGKTSTLFIKSWAQICKAGADSPALVHQLTPFYNREVIKDPTGLDSIYITQWLRQGGPNNRSLMIFDSVVPPDLVRATFEFTKDHIQKLRKCVYEKNSSKPPVHITSLSLACAFILVCVVRASENHVKKNRLAKFVFGVDCRYRLKPAIPSTYFGNCAIGRPAIVETKDLLGEDGILSALEGISEAIASLDDGLLDGVDSWASLINSKEPDEIPPTACIAWSPRFQVYNTDFGWGAPKKFEMTSIGRTGAICMSDSKNGNGGFEIGMVSQMKKIEAFASSFAKGLEALCNVRQSNSRAVVEFG
ncbi:malonyl-CoA:anthocyanidin 5-O-glucoside-6''-O-malonyltransferase-like [Ziziphus jujuba]|uniref:Malonyl-CoA:anthocyanidin 5-O-glucoside-6''-O-malonyltransferase-like n=1 Tax=Ziziphus jujuba TaxID=326968 RepID=A0ABM3IHT1_ZIZJJ|nr:malonyl-CoA:anthocyanidin 5-O-glucoside-6''-O-malonyltransferase-like [Ziziphus jujuba]